MFYESSQKRFWMLENLEKIATSQNEANKAYVKRYKILCSLFNLSPPAHYLAYHEEKLLLIHYSQLVYNVCKRFNPPVPPSVVGISISYFKRFYLNTSVMDFHPKDIAYLCVYLACKVDEYNVSIEQFMTQAFTSPTQNMQDFIIDNELLLLQKLDYHLTVHSPFRPMEGFLIDMKTKSSKIDIENIEEFRPTMEKFLLNCLLTDALLLHPPSQVALAAISHSIGDNLLKYLQYTLAENVLKHVLMKVDSIKDMVVNFRFPSSEEIELIEKKLLDCRDSENDPFSENYHRREAERKQQKDEHKKKKFQELYDIQCKEDKMLAGILD